MRIGDSIIDFTLPGTDGKIYSLSSFEKGKPIAVIFWCNHCPYVKAWEDRIIKIGNEFKEKVQFVLINANDPNKYPDDSFEKMKERAKEKNYPFPYLFDESQNVPRKYNAQRTPEIFLFDQNWKLVYHGAPDDNYEDEKKVKKRYFVDAIQSILNNQKPEISETHPVGCTIKWKN
ncbi:MAG: thioredoxin family protein [Candidatus Calescibacterium sp.]|nr:thioredoxin family protein [Candidatus Calescibacterium sp.]MCX7734379.1 thioredoxin family protein [bacterium]MDW8086857.1 thioredoxin family protein [Candidatus Calescibacterium sp.]